MERKNTEKGVNGVIKEEKGGQIRLDMEEVKFYFYSSQVCNIPRCMEDV